MSSDADIETYTIEWTSGEPRGLVLTKIADKINSGVNHYTFVLSQRGKELYRHGAYSCQAAVVPIYLGDFITGFVPLDKDNGDAHIFMCELCLRVSNDPTVFFPYVVKTVQIE
jgi:hypothetical protein